MANKGKVFNKTGATLTTTFSDGSVVQVGAGRLVTVWMEATFANPVTAGQTGMSIQAMARYNDGTDTSTYSTLTMIDSTTVDDTGAVIHTATASAGATVAKYLFTFRMHATGDVKIQGRANGAAGATVDNLTVYMAVS